MSYVVAVSRDSDGLADLMRSLEAQDYAGPKTLLVAVASDSDLTPQLAAELRQSSGVAVEFVANDANTPAAGLNESIARSQTAIVIRVSTGTVLPADYTRLAVSAIGATGAAMVGGRVRYRGSTYFEKAVARAFTLRVGRGSDPFVAEFEDGDTTSDAQAAFLRNGLIESGLYDEDLRAGHDWELNHRLIADGRRVWRTNALTRSDRPPRSLRALTHGQFMDGLWRGQVKRQFSQFSGLTYRLPLVIVLAVIGAFIVGAIGLFGLVAGAVGIAAVISTLFSFLLIIPLAYLVAVLALGVIVGAREGWRVGAWFTIVLPALHFSWGFGFLLGYLRMDPPVREFIDD